MVCPSPERIDNNCNTSSQGGTDQRSVTELSGCRSGVDGHMAMACPVAIIIIVQALAAVVVEVVAAADLYAAAQ